MSYLTSLWLVGSRSYLNLLRGKSIWFFLSASLLYGGITGLVIHRFGDRQDPNNLFGNVSLFMLVQGLLPLTSIWFSVATVREEISDRTITWLLSSPIHRSSIWLGKYLASMGLTLTVLLLGFSIAVVLAATAPGTSRQDPLQASSVLAFLWVLLLAPLPYCAIGLFLGLRFRWPMMIGAAFVFAWEEFISTAPSSSGVRSLTVLDTLRSLIYHWADRAWGLRELIREMTWGPDPEIRGVSEALQALAWFTLAALVLAFWAGARREFETAPKD